MNLNDILPQVEKLVEKANKTKPFVVKHGGKEYSLSFNGRNFEVYCGEVFYAEFNTRIKKTAKKWLLDELNN